MDHLQGKQKTMFDALTKFAEHYDVVLHGKLVFGWNDRSVGCQVIGKKENYWLRVVSEQKWWAQGDWWEGNLTSNQIQGIPKPEVIDVTEQDEADIVYRAELMSFISGQVCSSTPELRTTLRLSDEWWSKLRTSLDILPSYQTTRSLTNQEKVTRRFLVFYGDDVDSNIHTWTVAHGDLHWANVMFPQCTILDWESWGLAPVGYDAATLYCHSLLKPEIAEQVYTTFQDILDTEEGYKTQLYVITHLLRRIENGDFIDLAGHLHRHARTLLNRF